MMSNILLLEDDRRLGSNLFECLRHDQFSVTWCRSIEDLKKQQKIDFDLYLFDLNLPDGNSFEYFLELKKAKNASVIIITAYNEPDIRLKAFENKICDFISKPFTYRELKLRIDNAIQLRPKNNYRFQNLELDLNSYSVIDLRMNEKYQLPLKELELLTLLCRLSPEILSRDRIINQLWGIDYSVNPRTIDNMILNLRKIIEKCSAFKIESVWGRGYKLVIPIPP